MGSHGKGVRFGLVLSVLGKKIFIVGAGAAGYFAAIRLAGLRPDLEVVIIEKTSKTLQKVRISGGGRCNVTHHCFELETMLTNYPRGHLFLRQCLAKFGPAQTVEWFAQRGVKLKTEQDGRMFPITDSAETIAVCLEREARKLGVQLWLQTELKSIEKYESGFWLHTSKGNYETQAMLIATGGHPKLEGFAWLQQLGVLVVPPVPSLFTFNTPSHSLTSLQGISLPNVTLRLHGFDQTTSGPLLITHWGLSGPAVLKMSAWAARYLAEKRYKFQFNLDWLPEYKVENITASLRAIQEKHPKQWVQANAMFGLPSRLWKFFCLEAEIGEQQRWAETGKKHFQKLVDLLKNQQIEAQGKTTFKEEFVTAGGVDVGNVSPQTMESLQVPGLFFAGEVLDVDGVTGGFNFQAAWATGYSAAEGISKMIAKPEFESE